MPPTKAPTGTPELDVVTVAMGSGIYDQPDGPPVLFGDRTVFEFVGEAMGLVVFLSVKIGRNIRGCRAFH